MAQWISWKYFGAVITTHTTG